MEGEEAPSWRGPGGAVRELCRSFGHYNRHLARLQHNLRETKRFFRDVKYSQGHPFASAPAGDGPPSAGDGDGGPGDGGPGPAWFPRHEEEQLQRSVSWRPCLLILGQNCGAKGRLLNALLGQQLLPAPGAGTGDLPSPGTGTGDLPSPGAGNRNLLSSGTRNKELSSPGTGNRDLSSPGAGTEELPSPGTGNKELPSCQTGNGDLPSPGIGTEELPSPETGNRDLPSPGTGTGGLPSAGAGTRDLLPTLGTEELPAPGTGDLFPSPETGTEELLPSPTPSTEELLPRPGAGTGDRPRPGAGTGDRPRPGAGTGDRPRPGAGTEERCRRRRVRFTHGARTRLSLALPGQYELVQALAAHSGHWDTIPEQDLQVPGDAEDPAQRVAELEVVLPYALLKEVDIVVAPCRGFQSAEATLGEFVNQVLPVVTFAISEPQLSPSDQAELREIKEKFSVPIFFLRVSEPCGEPDRDKSTVGSEPDRDKSTRQLLDLQFLSPSSPCGIPGSSMLEKLRLLSAFSRQVLQQHLVQAATRLSEVHGRCLNIFINQAFDMQRDLQITPKRLEYTRRKESELYESLMGIANRKQEEMKDMIVETLGNMKEELLEDAASMEFRASDSWNIPFFSIFTGSSKVPSCQNSLFFFSLFSQRKIPIFLLFQILNAAYHVEVTFHSGSTVTRMLWEQIKQIIQRLTWVSPPAITSEWKRKVAQDAIESLSASKLAKSICSQFRTRLNSSHEAFAASLRQLEDGHSGRLERTEDLWLKVRKEHAPRLARLSLESRSLQDVLLHGKPRLGRELGRGQYGVVYLCDTWGGHFPCALKSVVPPDEKHWNDLALEFHYMRSLQSHERLVHLHGSVIDYSYGGGSSIAVLLIMERLHRDLYTGLKAGLELEPRLQIALDVVEGIRYLHSQGLVHRDIKLKNVLLDKKNRAKITDLGFCKPEAMMSGSIVGTPIHMAPELFTGKYDNSVDVYAFGILFWYLCSGHVKLPEAFERCASKDHLWNNVRRGVRPERLPVFDEECWQLMEACWDGDSSQRPLLGIVQPMLQGIMDRLCRAGSEHPNKGLDDST
ncbi:PREDICTED: dual serine/threonine and tyrosine protein kinase [Sturnus vulgaris]|uniref:dual serine/threonine and tyrosine protein kinase n=1 Tax=Sturnus vulgaris TaxID=9172 RepID=UPI000719ECA9|nr:PREDICTED: dual serine/threonine and tyrosine protein kinase [Sturnus vulgaris]